jgi:putative pyruvate formate lyase activating enzyme
VGRLPRFSSYGPHFGEEAPLVGRHGSGTIFFSYCNLGCIYCQNYTLSHLGEGQEQTIVKLASTMLMLQGMGCHNINLVSPTHQVPMIVEAIYYAVRSGLRLPIVYNSGGYDSVETLKLLEGIIDIYMPDFKYWDSRWAKKFSDAEDYPEVARAALKEMHRQVGDLKINPEGIAERGLLVRHLVLPGDISSTEEVMRFIAQEISPDTFVNVMDQYHPCFKAFEFPPLDRRPYPEEFQKALDAARRAGLKRIYY